MIPLLYRLSYTAMEKACDYMAILAGAVNAKGRAIYGEEVPRTGYVSLTYNPCNDFMHSFSICV